MRYGSLFSGIGGFDLAFNMAGMECAFMCEIDKNCQNILRRQFPEVKIYEDVKQINSENTEHVDLLCGGFPCQDLSVAGKRAGLAGERSGLFFEFLRIVEEIQPTWVVIENVPGLLSSNKGQDIQMIIDSFTQIGYIVDIDIKDSQEFGVAQRRRRVFIICVKLADLLQKKTSLSKQISADLIAQILLNIWGAIPQASYPVKLHWDYVSPTERSVNLLQKMTNLLEITLENSAYMKYQGYLDVLLDQFGAEEKDWTFGLSRKTETQQARRSKKMGTLQSESKAEYGVKNMSLWLNDLLEDVCKQENLSTISTLTNPITDQRIYTFAMMALHIIGRILPCLDWSESCWKVAQSISILLQENMNYAREASRSMFVEDGLRDCWRNYLDTASNIQSDLEQRIRTNSRPEILSQSESTPRDPAKSRKAGQETTRDPAGSAQEQRDINAFPDPAYAVQGVGTKFGSGRHNQDTFVAYSPFSHYGYEEADQTATLQGRENRQNGSMNVVFQQNTRDEVRLIGGDGQIAGAVASQPGAKQQNYVANWQSGGGKMDDDIAASLRSGAEVNYQFVYQADEEKNVENNSDNNNMDAKAIVSKGNGEAWLSDKHTSLSSSGGGQAGQGYPAVLVYDKKDNVIARESGHGYWKEDDVSGTIDNIGDGHPDRPALVANTNDQNSAGVRIQVNADKAVTLQGLGGGMSAKTGMYTTKKGVRRLTPLECERLQSFPEIEKSTIIQVCSGHLKNSVNAENLNLKLLKYVGNVERSILPEIAKYAENNLHISNQPINEPAVANVHIDLEHQMLLIHYQEKLLWSVNIAEKQNLSPLCIPIEDFVRLVVLMLTIQEKITHNGKGESLQNMMHSIPHKNGNIYVKLFGQEINELVNDAEKFTKMMELCLMFTISEAEQNSQITNWILTILSYCVATVIVSSIPEIIPFTNSFNLKLSTTEGWTSGQADSVRYRQLGNAVTVSVVYWIGKRIMEVENGNNR